MKKIFTSFLCFNIILGGFFFGGISSIYATESITIEVTENVPGANCSPGDDGIYECNLGTGFGSIMVIIGRMIKYATFLASLAGVLFIVINGILYSMSGMDSGLKEEAKKRIIKTLLGLVVLLLSGLILNMIAPWVYVV